jgi:hypothetical protein
MWEQGDLVQDSIAREKQLEPETRMISPVEKPGNGTGSRLNQRAARLKRKDITLLIG